MWIGLFGYISASGWIKVSEGFILGTALSRASLLNNFRSLISCRKSILTVLGKYSESYLDVICVIILVIIGNAFETLDVNSKSKKVSKML